MSIHQACKINTNTVDLQDGIVSALQSLLLRKERTTPLTPLVTSLTFRNPSPLLLSAIRGMLRLINMLTMKRPSKYDLVALLLVRFVTGNRPTRL
jgi:hypothetical protein